ncbi:MAG: hypothetical protein FJ138_04720 [Deltaproteobacteria bacterium]|nr:hypothetical protein [Deltaproteobacteria bacterium]
MQILTLSRLVPRSPAPAPAPPRRPRVALIAVAALLCLSALSACNSEKKKVRGGSCKVDDDCAEGWICDPERFCTPGQRSAEELAARERAEAEARQRQRQTRVEQEMTTQKGEGRLSVKICPFFKNVSDSVGSVIAVHADTKRRHILSLQMETPKGNMRSEFTFPSLPLGKYTLTANYGIQVNGVFDTHPLKCDPKATRRECVDGGTRVVEVVLPERDVKAALECDWIAE